MTEQLYLKDSYLKEVSADVLEIIDGTWIVLDKTVFYPQGGGQPGDTGTLNKANESYKVLNTVKREGKVLHEVDEKGLTVGDQVRATIDWDRRYKLMRFHTAAHILSAVFHNQAGALITGNQIAEDKLRIDFSLENYDPLQIQHYIAEANRLIALHLQVHTKVMPREEALQMPGMVKLAGAVPPNLPELRIVTIGEGEQIVDEQADGGTHVENTNEIGTIILKGSENKGKANRRITVGLE